MTDKPLEGRVALVTGSSRGIGRGIAIGLGEAGATVIITGRSTGDGPLTIDTTAGMVDEAGGVGVPIVCDHGDDASIEACVAEIRERFGRLDILVNNAFKIPDPPVWGGKFWEHPLDVWDDQVGIGLRGGYVTSVFATRLMVDTPDRVGLIVNISSSGAERYAFSASYGISKAGADRLSRDMAVEAKDDGITVIGLWPSQVLTEFIVESAEKGDIEIDAEHAETPLYSGRVVAKLAADPDRMARSGIVFTTAELAQAYDVHDERGMQPVGKRVPTTYRTPV